jgi:hypothetical protein
VLRDGRGLPGFAIDGGVDAHDHGLAVDQGLSLLVAVAGGNDERFLAWEALGVAFNGRRITSSLPSMVALTMTRTSIETVEKDRSRQVGASQFRVKACGLTESL